VFPLQIPGGVEILVLLLVWGVLGLLPIVAALAALYLLYRIRKDTKSMAASLERLAESDGGTARATPGVENAGTEEGEEEEGPLG
jgi:hypothetical protein